MMRQVGEGRADIRGILRVSSWEMAAKHEARPSLNLFTALRGWHRPVGVIARMRKRFFSQGYRVQ